MYSPSEIPEPAKSKQKSEILRGSRSLGQPVRNRVRKKRLWLSHCSSHSLILDSFFRHVTVAKELPPICRMNCHGDRWPQDVFHFYLIYDLKRVMCDQRTKWRKVTATFWTLQDNHLAASKKLVPMLTRFTRSFSRPILLQTAQFPNLEE